MKELIKRHMEYLCGEIGSRPTGTENNKIATDYVYKEFKKLGLDAKKDTFKCIDVTNNTASLEIDGKEISEIIPSSYTNPCDVKSKFIMIDNLEKLRSTNLNNKIIALHGELTVDSLMPKSFVFYNPDEHKEIIKILENSGIQAIITESRKKDNLITYIEDGDFLIPTAVISKESFKMLKKNPDAKLHLKINTKKIDSSASNIVASYGSGKKKIALSAHIDTKLNTVGATDNAAGVATLLAVASKLKERDLEHELEFIILNGEDYYSNPGEMYYIKNYLNHPENYIGNINVDGNGMKDSPVEYSFYEYPEDIKFSVREIAKSNQSMVEGKPWPASDHSIFASFGIPAIALISTELLKAFDVITHTPNDNLSIIDYSKIEDTAKFILDIL